MNSKFFKSLPLVSSPELPLFVIYHQSYSRYTSFPLNIALFTRLCVFYLRLLTTLFIFAHFSMSAFPPVIGDQQLPPTYCFFSLSDHHGVKSIQPVRRLELFASGLKKFSFHFQLQIPAQNCSGRHTRLNHKISVATTNFTLSQKTVYCY